MKCEPELGERLRASYEAVVPGYHLNKRHWITVTLGGDVPDAMARDLDRGQLRPRPPGKTPAMTIGPPRARAFPHRLAGHCGSGALRDLLEHHGLDYGRGPLSEGAVFGLAGGLGFLYLEVPQMTPPVYLVGRTAGLERDVAAHLGLGLEVRETDDPDEGWRWVRAEIDAGSPPMVWADIAELEYLRVRMANTRHDIVVVDYDDDEQVAFIADNDRDELQRCSYASLAAARSSTRLPGPEPPRHVRLRRGRSGCASPSEAVAAALDRAVANMRGGGELLGELPGGAGLEGVDDFAASYPAWPERFGEQLDRALSGLRVFIVKAGHRRGDVPLAPRRVPARHGRPARRRRASRDAAGVYDELARRVGRARRRAPSAATTPPARRSSRASPSSSTPASPRWRA